MQVEGSPWAPCPPGKAIQVGLSALVAARAQSHADTQTAVLPNLVVCPLTFSLRKLEQVMRPHYALLPNTLQIPGYRGLLLCPRGRLCQTNESTNAVTSPPVSLSTQHLLFELSLGLAGPPSHYLGKEERDELAEAVLQALVNRGGTGR